MISGSLVKKAVDLLEPLVETETNPEYRYLLARCYTSIASDPRQRDQRQTTISKAVDLLSELVKDQPNVSDYKYEFAIASLELAQPDPKERLRATEQIVKITKEISKQNPAISTYAIVHGRALSEHVQTLTRVADETSNQKQQFKLRVIAKDTMDLAEANWTDMQQRFPDAREELANPMRPAPLLKELKFEVEAKLSLAQAMQLVKANRLDEARALLVPLRARCLEELKRMVDKRPMPGRNGQSFGSGKQREPVTELVTLLCKTEQFLEGEDATLAILDRAVEKRRIALEDRMPSSKEIATLMKARVLQSLGKDADANKVLNSLRERLRGELDKFEGRPTFKMMIEGSLYRDVLNELNEPNALRAFEEQVRDRFDRFRRSGRPRSNNGRSNNGRER